MAGLDQSVWDVNTGDGSRADSYDFCGRELDLVAAYKTLVSTLAKLDTITSSDVDPGRNWTRIQDLCGSESGSKLGQNSRSGTKFNLFGSTTLITMPYSRSNVCCFHGLGGQYFIEEETKEKIK